MTHTPKNCIPNDKDSDRSEFEEKVQPYFKLTVEDVKRHYQLGLITATGYLYYIIKTSRKDGWGFRIPNIQAFCNEWGLKRATFYKAKNKLISLGLIGEEIHGAISLWATSNLMSLFETPVTFVDAESQIVDTESQIVDTAPSRSQSEQAFQEAYRSLTDLYTDLSHTPPPPTPEVCVSTNILFPDPENQSGGKTPGESSLPKPPDRTKISTANSDPRDVKISADFLSRMKNIGANLQDEELQAAMLNYPGRLGDAIAAAEEKRDQLHSPTSFLKRAILNGWKPERTGSVAPVGFAQWFEEARSRHLVLGSYTRDGIIYIMVPDPDRPDAVREFKFETLRRKSWAEVEAIVRPLTVEADVLGDSHCLDVGVLASEAVEPGPDIQEVRCACR